MERKPNNANLQSTPVTIEELLEMLRGNEPDSEGFLQSISNLLRFKAGAVAITCTGNLSVNLEFFDSTGDFCLDHAVAKVRNLCARLAKIRELANNSEFLPYGGEGDITLTGRDGVETNLHIVYENTQVDQFFRLSSLG